MAPNTLWRILLFAFMFSAYECCQSIRKEGVSTSFYCVNNSFTTSQTWQIRTDQTFLNVAYCNLSANTCINSEPEMYTGSIDNSSKTKHIVRLWIHKVRRNETEFRCDADTKGRSLTCLMEVYVPPTTPTCDPVTLDSTEKNLEITCRTENVYPSLKTALKRRGTVGHAINGTCRKLYETESPRADRNPVECIWRVLAANMDPGDYTYYVEMYAEVSNFTESGQRVVTSPDINVALRSSSADIDASCTSGAFLKQGFILIGKDATCKCRLATVGFPPGKAGWYTQDGRSVGTYNPSDRSSTLTLLYKSLDHKETFHCRAESSLLANDTGVTYRPTVAYAPNMALVEITAGTSPSLCPGRSPTTTFTCMTPFVASQPKVLFSVFVDDGIIIKKREGNQTLNFYTYTVVIRHTRGGKSQLTCVVENFIFSELSVSKSLQVEVREPPSEEPFFIISGSQATVGNTTVIIPQGTNVTITCRTHGGYPPVNNVTIICGSEISVTVGAVSVLVLSASKLTNRLKCTCSANHVTGCYHKTSDIFLQMEDASNNNGRQDTWMIVGSVVGGIVILAIVTGVVVVILHCIRQRRERFRSADNLNTEIRTYANPYIIPNSNVSSPRLHTAQRTSESSEPNVYENILPPVFHSTNLQAMKSL